ncbi:hypothetical protein SAMN05421503_0520 [Terribacillus aidingensis]|jgi:hypothetical protein|uniref:Uncharacterized protein n=2 Tax=Terribacillus TaxID=459532 RepID=A0A1G6HX18_9BACI|nr:hypothetical protein SAMN05421663_10163 [Terribacillus halophilus]SNZ04051.1 hypothetical protein SAMN05421503_0520 [Terribacillus aidingensis]
MTPLIWFLYVIVPVLGMLAAFIQASRMKEEGEDNE